MSLWATRSGLPTELLDGPSKRERFAVFEFSEKFHVGATSVAGEVQRARQADVMRVSLGSSSHVHSRWESIPRNEMGVDRNPERGIEGVEVAICKAVRLRVARTVRPLNLDFQLHTFHLRCQFHMHYTGGKPCRHESVKCGPSALCFGPGWCDENVITVGGRMTPME